MLYILFSETNKNMETIWIHMARAELQVELLAPFGAEGGTDSFKLSFAEEPTLDELIKTLVKRRGDAFAGKMFRKNGTAREGIAILVDGINVQMEGQYLTRVIKSGSSVVFCIAVSGG
jgi:hypothetical protein